MCMYACPHPSHAPLCCPDEKKYSERERGRPPGSNDGKKCGRPKKDDQAKAEKERKNDKGSLKVGSNLGKKYVKKSDLEHMSEEEKKKYEIRRQKATAYR